MSGDQEMGGVTPPEASVAGPSRPTEPARRVSSFFNPATYFSSPRDDKKGEASAPQDEPTPAPLEQQPPKSQTQQQPPALQQPPEAAEPSADMYDAPYETRTPDFYILRDMVKNKGLGNHDQQTLNFMRALKDEYDEQQYRLNMELNRVGKANVPANPFGSFFNSTGGFGNPTANPPSAAQFPYPIQSTDGKARTTPRLFTIKPQGLPTFSGERSSDKVVTFLTALERCFNRRARELQIPGTDGWGDYAVDQLKDKAASWGQYEWPVGCEVNWDAFKKRVTEVFVPAGTVDELESQMAELQIHPNQSIEDFNQKFQQLRLKLRIVGQKHGTPLAVSDNEDQNVIKMYLTKLKQAANKEKGRDRVRRVFAQLQSWRITDATAMFASLSTIMIYCQRIDEALNGDGGVQPLTETTAVVSTGDPMDLSNMELFKMGVEYGKSEGGRGSRKGGYEGRRTDDLVNSNAATDWKRNVKCYGCGNKGHLKRECRITKARKEKAALKLVEVEEVSSIDSDTSNEEEGN